MSRRLEVPPKPDLKTFDYPQLWNHALTLGRLLPKVPGLFVDHYEEKSWEQDKLRCAVRWKKPDVAESFDFEGVERRDLPANIIATKAAIRQAMGNPQACETRIYDEAPQRTSDPAACHSLAADLLQSASIMSWRTATGRVSVRANGYRMPKVEQAPIHALAEITRELAQTAIPDEIVSTTYYDDLVGEAAAFRITEQRVPAGMSWLAKIGPGIR